MLLTSAHVRAYKSIEDSSPVAIDEDITVLVGQNESGKMRCSPLSRQNFGQFKL
jgi:predicted ATP-dependent endonuclease of OLD family